MRRRAAFLAQVMFRGPSFCSTEMQTSLFENCVFSLFCRFFPSFLCVISLSALLQLHYLVCPMKKMVIQLVKWKYRLPLTWLLVLFLLYSMDTNGRSLCLFTLLGLPDCPGCGLGHAMHAALHGEIRASFDAHVLGIPALLAIFHQVFTTSRIKQKNYSIWTNE
jgi:hypothetical protein